MMGTGDNKKTGSIAGRSLKNVLGVIFPPICPGCGVHVAQNGTICPTCWGNLCFISRPFCPVMGTPFPYDAGADFLSAAALQNPPPFRSARAVVIHDGLAQRLVTRLKYGSHTELAPWMADWMMRAASDFFNKRTFIIPVPLHRLRFWMRGYNQSAELARRIAAKTQTRFFPEGLVRGKRTRPQVGLTAKARQHNVRAAFYVPQSMRCHIHGRPVVLVDDVFTTGATVCAATTALLKAGAAHVDVLTFSRVILS